MNLGYYTYLLSALAYGVLLILLISSWNKSYQARILVVVSLVSMGWSLVASQVAIHPSQTSVIYSFFEIARYSVWYWFLLKLFDLAEGQSQRFRRFLRWALPASIGFTIILFLLDSIVGLQPLSPGYAGYVLLSITGLAIIEQLYRNTAARHRWSIKFLIFGAGGIFVCDLFLYSHALLFRGLDLQLWESRGIVQIVVVPLLAIAAARNKSWSMSIFVSREIVLNTTAIVGAGLYLFVMALAGYYLREVGGDWGILTQALFFSLSLALLIVVLSSDQLRSRARVFLGKHFYKNKYDYRSEWLRLTKELARGLKNSTRYSTAIRVLAQIVEARSGLLWLRDGRGNYINAGSWQTRKVGGLLNTEDPFIKFLKHKRFVINFLEIDKRTDEYSGLEIPELFNQFVRPWLIIPLLDKDQMIGFVVLGNPLLVRPINWEDHDLLKTASNQVAGFLLMHETSEQLAEAKQFEVFNRLSAFMVHDLKNIAAELELIGRNAERFGDKPDFIKDAFETVNNASVEIKRLLEQFRSRKMAEEKNAMIDISEFLTEVVKLKQQKQPRPELEILCDSAFVTTDRRRLENVIAHIIDNAQEATGSDGSIKVKLIDNNSEILLEVSDTGCGMDKAFVENRLFKAFDTTKGNAGMGIGMYESREFIRRLGGDINVESKPNMGTKMQLSFPKATPASLNYGNSV